QQQQKSKTDSVSDEASDGRSSKESKEQEKEQPSNSSSSLGGTGSGSSNETDADDMSRYHKVWRMVNRLKTDGDVTKVGICDVTKQQLSQLCLNTGFVPDMVQIRVNNNNSSKNNETTATTVVSDDLRAYAGENGISIRTHSDSMVMLSNATFQALAGDFKINERFPTTEVPPDGYKIDPMRPRWVANYSVDIRNRGLVANRGYIVMASSDRVLDPNRVSRTDYEE
ncbi:hypothetical protein IWW50_006937, partial [Coemansia erecta]